MPEERKNLARWQEREAAVLAGGLEALAETISENDPASPRYQDNIR